MMQRSTWQSADNGRVLAEIDFSIGQKAAEVHENLPVRVPSMSKATALSTRRADAIMTQGRSFLRCRVIEFWMCFTWRGFATKQGRSVVKVDIQTCLELSCLKAA